MRAVVAMAASVSVLIALTGCTAEPVQKAAVSHAITTPQAALAGEWVLTRTVIESDDPTAANRAAGAESTRYLQFTASECADAVCGGIISSGGTLDERQQTPYEPLDGGVRWAYDGMLDCTRAESGAVLVVDAFTYGQAAELRVVERADVGGVDTATRLEGTINYTDSLTTTGLAGGCVRDPITVSVTYAVVAVRSTNDPATEG
ncbi:MAG: hypothetical protein ACOH1T_11670 [Microbacteriaceae bacterium]